MNMVMHIFRKDLRRLRIFLLFWIPVVLAASIAGSLRPPADDFAMQATLNIVTAFTMMLQYILLALIVPMLLHSEPLTGTTAFWLTRPIARADVLKSKLLFCGLFFVAVPLLIQAGLLIVNQVPAAYILPAAIEQAMRQTASLLLVIALAALTRNFGFFALAAAVYLVASVLFGAVVAIYSQFNLFEGITPAIALADSRELLASIAALLLLSGVILIQFRYRKSSWSYTVLTVQFALTLWLSMFCPVQLFNDPVGPLAPSEKEQIKVSLGNKTPHISDAFSMRGGKNNRKELSGKFRFDQLPKHGFVRISEVNAAFEAADRKAGEPIHLRTFSMDQESRTALRSLLEPLTLVSGGNQGYFSNRLLKLNEADYRALKGQTGTYSADVTFNVFRYTRAAALPLEQGAEYKARACRIAIASVLHETMGCTIIVREQNINPLFKRDRRPTTGGARLYLLVNAAAGEAYLEEKNNHNLSINLTHSSSLQTRNRFLRFSSLDKPGEINEAWLEGAELLIIEPEWLGTVKKHLIENDFDFPGTRSTYTESIPGSSAQDHADELAQIRLPENPTREQLESYIAQIHTVSATQASFAPSDPQKDMLKQVGAEHLDLLLESAVERNGHYELFAVLDLAGPEHKTLILNNLKQKPELAKLVRKFEWHDAARTTLLNGLKRKEYLPESWLQAVTDLEDPQTYPALLHFLVEGRNRNTAYKAIKALPGITLDDAVAQAWQQARYAREWERIDMLTIAIAHGHLSALETAARELGNDTLQPYQHRNIRTAIKKHTNANGSDKELADWIRTRKGHLRFDAENRRFMSDLPVDTAPRSTPTARKEALLREMRGLLADHNLKLKLSDARLAENDDLILHFEAGSALTAGATATVSNPTPERRADAVRKMASVLKVSASRGKKVKSMAFTDSSKVAVQYE